jgi:hypothetical protein
MVALGTGQYHSTTAYNVTVPPSDDAATVSSPVAPLEKRERACALPAVGSRLSGGFGAATQRRFECGYIKLIIGVMLHLSRTNSPNGGFAWDLTAREL